MSEEEKRAIINHATRMGITLNGKPATICGARLRFAVVAQTPLGESYEWSWDAVERILSQGGEFTS